MLFMQNVLKKLFKPKKIVTLDVGSHTLKMAEFSFKKRDLFLQNFATLPVTDNCIEQGDLINVEPLTNSLSEFLEQNLNPPVPDIRVSMSGRSIIIKKIEILKSEKSLVNDLIKEEAKQTIPFDLSEINYDYTPLEKIEPTDDRKASFLLVGAKNNIVSNINDMIENAGYKCAGIDTGVFAISSCLKFIEPDINKVDEHTIIFDIGKSGTTVIVLKQGELIFSRYMTVGSDLYTTNLSKEMNMDLTSAEALKLSYVNGQETPPEAKKILQESDYHFCDELYLVNEYFKNQYPDQTFSRGFVTGGGGKMTNMTKNLSTKFNIPIQLLDPFEKLELNQDLENSQEHIKHFSAISIGLGLRG